MSQIPPMVPGSPPDDLQHAAPDDESRRDFLIAGSTVAGATLIPLSSLTAAPAQSDPQSSVRRTPLTITVNGERRAMQVDNRQSLLDLLRESLQLTGTKKGCNQGACGACTVLVDGRRIVSCLAPAVLYDGAEVTTIEGLAVGDRLHPLQQAFIDHEGFQCGYCTAGQIMSGVACIKEGHATSEQEAKYWMSGNICRCGAYAGISAAVVDAAQREQS
ncbi:(2Fe-2S)-binding protein [Pseudoxanthomonas sp. SL93]|uniref:(2Fe-2S)-binding protein n=1 Tax=Pseudoxanthomonas sp. SL93 TaxID=2995142 RepID=UPI0022721AF5|nr:(2Fe-2S)-binding protein [Pseudoxanthomonas sp. SL93]WAC64028.1 (2Fe-2S)-binding protein [Pseudoxanthomonas sp. SL93]